MNRKKLYSIMLMLAAALLIFPYVQHAEAAPTGSGAVTPAQKHEVQADCPVVTKTVYGVYVGLADGHTVEISVYGEPVALQFTDKLELDLAGLETGDQVRFTYTEQKAANDPRALLTRLLSIRKLNDASHSFDLD